jgi:monofunctional biosynthetic peptidoglycan transglycosylase
MTPITITTITLLMISVVSPSLRSQTIASFENPSDLRGWNVVNDSVMGGRSTSGFEQTPEGNLLFRGELSLENNGGFVSIRNQPNSFVLQDVEGLKLMVRGDGRTYYLDLRGRGRMTSGSFRAAFPTQEGRWTEIFLPISKFVRQSFGRLYPNAPLDLSDLNSLGFTLSDKKPGPFQLEIKYVKATPSAASENTARRSPTPIPQPQGPRALIEFAISRGVPLFNEGLPNACAAIYEIACRSLIESNAIPEPARASLMNALEKSAVTNSDTGKAWILRNGLDNALRLLPQR